jgi:hypothetical protein
MKLRMCIRGLLAGAISVMALTGGTGVAAAQPDDTSPGGPNIIINQLISGSVPSLRVDTQDEGGPGQNWGGVGMYCQNLFVRCNQESITH